jgi:hypothetical protein
MTEDEAHNTYESIAMTYTKFPHCDNLILHAPGICEVCDIPEYRALSQARTELGINFSGIHDEDKFMCPAEKRRNLSTIEKWPGNIARPPWKLPNFWDHIKIE